MSKVLALIFYNGRVFMGSEGVMFEGENIAIYLKRDCTLEELKARVHKKLKLRRNQVISKVRVRLWRSDNPLTYHGNSITDDEDMEMMMERYNEDSHLICTNIACISINRRRGLRNVRDVTVIKGLALTAATRCKLVPL